jgi:hypothetical protein
MLNTSTYNIISWYKGYYQDFNRTILLTTSHQNTIIQSIDQKSVNYVLFAAILSTMDTLQILLASSN